MTDDNSGPRWQRIERRPSGTATRVEIGPRAERHIHEAARSCGGTLGNEVLALARPVDRVWTYLGPSEEPPPFDQHLGDSMMDLTPFLEDVRSHLASGDDVTIVFHDAMAKPSDRFLGTLRTERFTFGDEVYHYLRGPHSREQIEAFELDTHEFWRFGVLTKMTPSIVGEAERIAIRRLAREARYVLVSAWVGDGDPVWSFDQLSL